MAARKANFKNLLVVGDLSVGNEKSRAGPGAGSLENAVNSVKGADAIEAVRLAGGQRILH